MEHDIEGTEAPVSLWKICDTMLEKEPGAIFPKLVQEMMVELSAARKRIEAAGGYHARTEREVEIAESMEDPNTRQDWPDVSYLLELVDAGRNRVHLAETENESLKARERNLECQCGELEGLLENAQADSKKWRSKCELHIREIRELVPAATTVTEACDSISKKLETLTYALDVANSIAEINMLKMKFAKSKVEVLEEAIRTHRRQKADDRCIEDDDRLYEILGDGIKCDRRVGSKFAMANNCMRFIENRCQGGRWATYAQLEAALAKILAVATWAGPHNAQEMFEKIQSLVHEVLITETAAINEPPGE